MQIKTERFELEMESWRRLHWFQVDVGQKRYTIYRDLDGKLAREVTKR